MQHEQVPFVDVAAQVEVQRLTLADERCAIGGELDHPALVDLECSTEHRLLVFTQSFEVLHGTFVRQDRLPGLFGIQALFRPGLFAGPGYAR
jgi:hypothetical protein